MSVGVFFGTPTPAHTTDSAPGTKSPMVGMSGSASERVAVVTARGRSLPDLMYSIVPSTLAVIWHRTAWVLRTIGHLVLTPISLLDGQANRLGKPDRSAAQAARS